MKKCREDVLINHCNRCFSEDDSGSRFPTGFFDEEEGWTCAECIFIELKGLRADAQRFITVLGREGYAKLCRFMMKHVELNGELTGCTSLAEAQKKLTER